MTLGKALVDVVSAQARNLDCVDVTPCVRRGDRDKLLALDLPVAKKITGVRVDPKKDLKGLRWVDGGPEVSEVRQHWGPEPLRLVSGCGNVKVAQVRVFLLELLEDLDPLLQSHLIDPRGQPYQAASLPKFVTVHNQDPFVAASRQALHELIPEIALLCLTFPGLNDNRNLPAAHSALNGLPRLVQRSHFAVPGLPRHEDNNRVTHSRQVAQDWG
mmetsp:Transcript_9105/g.18654  ORF Transcript_9105/g.18654 Transcript_9105/m.18654 type:complete len:215 (-) Transcript_9105:455-1099(-)